MSTHDGSLDEKKVVTSTAPALEEGFTEDLFGGTSADGEVFKKTSDGVDFRTVSWPRASIIFLKIQFAIGVLSIPSSMYTLGAVGGALSVIAWGALNTYTAVVQGDFRNRHPGIHTIADMSYVLGGTWLREFVGALFVVGYILCTGSGILGVSIGINAVSHHGACTVWWSVIATVVIATAGSMRKFHSIGWLMWVGFISIFTAVMIVVIAVTVRDRPATAPQTGPFDLGYHLIAYPSFISGMSASATIFISSFGASAFIPVIAEMRNPREYRKAVYLCMAITNGAYLSLSLVVYRWCGKWVASPSLGSAGQTVKMVAYGVGMVGLVASAVVYLHVAAKYMFVRILRGSRHLQSNSVVHWGTWLSCTFGLAALSFVLAEAIPIFNYLLALTASICFAPLSFILPAFFWLHDFRGWRNGSLGQQVAFHFHCFIALLGSYMCVAGTYATVQLIIDAYAEGLIGNAFSCADNSNSS